MELSYCTNFHNFLLEKTGNPSKRTTIGFSIKTILNITLWMKSNKIRFAEYFLIS